MDKFLIRNLEGYLSGQLGEPHRREFERLLEKCERDRKAIEQMAHVSGLFGTLNLPEEDSLGPSPGFHARVLDRIERNWQPPFWDFFLRPVVIKRVALASCAWLFLLFSANLYQTSGQPSIEQIAQTVLAQPPESADYCNVRLGCDIELNRSSMLAAVMISGSTGR